MEVFLMSKVRLTLDGKKRKMKGVVLCNEADVRAAEKLGYQLQRGVLLSGERATFAFASHSEVEVQDAQDEINRESNKIVMPKGSNPVIRGALIKSSRIYRRN